MVNADELARLNVERHGAIRVGTAQELATLRRMVCHYGDVPGELLRSLAGRGAGIIRQHFGPLMLLLWRVIPSAFLPHYSALSLSRTNYYARKRRRFCVSAISSPHGCRQLLQEYEQRGGFNETQAQEFVQEALETFRWHQSATVDEKNLSRLAHEHRLIADVVLFSWMPYQPPDATHAGY